MVLTQTGLNMFINIFLFHLHIWSYFLLHPCFCTVSNNPSLYCHVYLVFVNPGIDGHVVTYLFIDVSQYILVVQNIETYVLPLI